CVVVAAVTVALMPPIFTVFEAGVAEKLLPVMVAEMPGVSVAGDTLLMEGAGAAATVTVAVPTLPSLVALMVAVPMATPVTRPLELTVALVASDVAQVTE